MTGKFKHIIFFFLITLLTLPMFQQFIKVIDPGELHGDFTLSEEPDFTWQSWMDGSFQQAYDRYVEDHIWFRSFFVRVNNQIEFSLYNKTKADGVVIGKDNVLYEYDYIRAFTGEDFMGKAAITSNLNKVKFLQTYLKKNFNITFLLLFEPSKARVYPEFIPDKFLETGVTISNYEYYIQKATELGINSIDFNDVFVQARDTAKHPLYPPYGIHWSENTMAFVCDSLIRNIEKHQDIDMAEFEIETRFVKDSISASDYDAGSTLNLLFQLPQAKIPYPFFTFRTDHTKDKPMVLAVADSYYWNIYNTHLALNLFANEAFWYFNSKVYPDFYHEDTWTKDLNLQKQIEKQDVIILGVTERFLYKFGWDFVRQAYKLYSPEYTGDLLEGYESRILSHADWFNELLERSKSEGIPVFDIIANETKFLAYSEDLVTYLTWYGIEHYASFIQSDSSWNTSIITKAKINKLDFNEQLINDANWLFKDKHPIIYQKYSLIKKYEKLILSDSVWLKSIQKKSDEIFIPLNLLVQIDAEYLANQDLSPKTDFDKRVVFYENRIRKTPEWLERVTKKASEKKVHVYKMIRADAIYMAKQELKNNDK